MSNTTTATLPILTAVNEVFQALRTEHPEIPNVNIVIGASGRKRNGQVHGHFWAETWANPEFQDAETDSPHTHEIFLSGESLERGGLHTLGTIIHESAHALAYARGVRDTSNQGRYHNKRFKKTAEELGILLEQSPTIGWSLTRVSSVSIIKYQRYIDLLDKALTTYRVREDAAKPKVRTKTKAYMDCGCEDPVTVSIQWFERHAGSLRCDDCLEEFRIVEGN